MTVPSSVLTHFLPPLPLSKLSTMNNEHYVYKQESQDLNNVSYSPIYSNQGRQQLQSQQQQLPQQYQQFADYPGIAIDYGYSGFQFPLYSADSYTTYPQQQQIPKYYPQPLIQHQQLPNQQHSNSYQQPLQQQASLNGGLRNNIPRFIRTSEVRQGTESLGYTGISRMMLRTGKAELNIYGNLNGITETAWTPQELSTCRRLVRFERNQKGSEIELSFEILPYHEYHEDAANLNSSPGSKSAATQRQPQPQASIALSAASSTSGSSTLQVLTAFCYLKSSSAISLALTRRIAFVATLRAISPSPFLKAVLNLRVSLT